MASKISTCYNTHWTQLVCSTNPQKGEEKLLF